MRAFVLYRSRRRLRAWRFQRVSKRLPHSAGPSSRRVSSCLFRLLPARLAAERDTRRDASALVQQWPPSPPASGRVSGDCCCCCCVPVPARALSSHRMNRPNNGHGPTLTQASRLAHTPSRAPTMRLAEWTPALGRTAIAIGDKRVARHADSHVVGLLIPCVSFRFFATIARHCSAVPTAAAQLTLEFHDPERMPLRWTRSRPRSSHRFEAGNFVKEGQRCC